MNSHDECGGASIKGVIFRLRKMSHVHPNFLELSCATGPNALVPRMTAVLIRRTPAVAEPRTTTATTASFAGFLNDAALGTYEIDVRRAC